MGLLNLFSKPGAAVQRLPSGTITVDRHGNVVMTTVASIYPEALLRDIAGEVLALFREARTVQMPLNELILDFASLRISAREMRGGAIIFLAPVSTFATSPPF
jgi:hypothetical protein